jgi:putative transposase
VYHYAIEWYRLNTDVHNHKLKNIYEVSGVSKQAHMQYMSRREKDEFVSRLVVSTILEIRLMHNMMGLKKIYRLLSPDWIGRDRFIAIGMESGLGIKIAKSFHRTTFSCKSAWFSNLTVGLAITGINQVWVSDITYFRVGETFYYLTFIVDVYSRRILGYVASTNLRAEANCTALESALSVRVGYNLKGLIHHSDRGSQYISNDYLKILSQNQIAVSMCNSVYENTHMERVNGIIKNEYLSCQSIKTFNELKRRLKQAVWLYNEQRPHWSLNIMTPAKYEENLSNIAFEQRQVMFIYSEQKQFYVQQSFFN